MKKVILGIIIMTIFMFVSCNGQSFNKRENDNYITGKQEFDSNLTSHFPKVLSSFPNMIINNKNLSKNDVCFILYEFNVDHSRIDSILHNKQFIAIYEPKTPCLFRVNSFETIDTYENRKEVLILDTLLINKDCYKDKYPVPNFMIYNGSDKLNLELENSLTIYILDSKKGNHFPLFELQPDEQMPETWKNGYSKGIAVSKEKGVIIYWAIIW